jgi:CRP-like cAMP-binding protein
LKELDISKGQVLQRSGDLNTSIFVVKSGLLRSYTIDEKGKEHIFMFAPEGWIIADSLAADIPADLFIDALEDSVVIQKEKVFEDHTHDTTKLLNRLGVLQKRIIMLISTPALDRYEHFIKTYPDIVQRVPQRMVASFLGITPEALSTVKRKRQFMQRSGEL